MPLLFSYGSNHPAQLASRLGHDVTTRGASLPGYERVFCGRSQRWDGGVASLRVARGAVVYGLVADVTKADLARLDVFEGVAGGHYARRAVRVVVAGRRRVAVAYVALAQTYTPPSTAYLRAVARTIGTHWRTAADGRVTWRDVTVRACVRAPTKRSRP